MTLTERSGARSSSPNFNQWKDPDCTDVCAPQKATTHASHQQKRPRPRELFLRLLSPLLSLVGFLYLHPHPHFTAKPHPTQLQSWWSKLLSLPPLLPLSALSPPLAGVLPLTFSREVIISGERFFGPFHALCKQMIGWNSWWGTAS